MDMLFCEYAGHFWVPEQDTHTVAIAKTMTTNNIFLFITGNNVLMIKVYLNFLNVFIAYYTLNMQQGS
jgi:hypothetical protein